MDYKVTWSVDIFDVNTPEEAALEAWKKYFQNSSDRIANVFTVQIDKESGAEISVDLQEKFDLEKERPEEATAFGFDRDDIINRAYEEGYDIDEKDAAKILEMLLHKADMNAGVSWETVDFFIGQYASEHNIEKTEDEDTL